MNLFGIIIFTVIGLSLIAISRLMKDFSPSDKKVQEDLKAMRVEVDKWSDELVPLDSKELELFSLNQVRQQIKKRGAKTAKGIYTSIYDEPVLAYSYKRYIAPSHNAILYVRTANHEIAYRIKKDTVKIVLNDELVGTIRSNGVLYSGKSNRMLAKINRDNEQLLPVLVKDREVASLTKDLELGKKKGISKRAFEFVKPDLNKEESDILVALSALELVMETVD